MNAFTCTGSYAILILCGIKRTEDRSMMPDPSEGRAAISCPKSFCRAEYGQFIVWAPLNLSPEDFERLPSWREVKDWPGKIVGVCDYKVHDGRDFDIRRARAASTAACAENDIIIEIQYERQCTV